MNANRLVWALWACVPVAAMAFHFGPGQTYYQQDLAVARRSDVRSLEKEAQALQAVAYQRHLEALKAKQRASVEPTTENETLATECVKAETDAFNESSAAWRKVAGAYDDILHDADKLSLAQRLSLRWSRSRALVRSGDLWAGIGDLEAILDEAETIHEDTTKLRISTREELAAAYYYAARLMRLSGEPPEEWMVEAGKARQHFRYLAEFTDKNKPSDEKKQDYERDVERVLNLEQSTLVEIEGKPLPKDSPLARRGDRPGNRRGKSPRPPNQRDGRGAGGAEAVNSGW